MAWGRSIDQSFSKRLKVGYCSVSEKIFGHVVEKLSKSVNNLSKLATGKSFSTFEVIPRVSF